ncbi:FimV/HubP family polar landmark protein [Nitrosomonas sp.]|uniref:FimV/HubP family polar landmark protein n=1 Tax=Nitrosomonas sp. TaxID=42353 RepID=UPI0025DC12FC|nr:FimV/HubP family polar landmark protein [Nitrosomonas sp.]
MYLFGFIFTISVNAAGLGKLTINSSLGQPLNAEIDLVSVSEEELSTLKAEFASREAFAQAGIRYEPFFSTFRVSIESRVNGIPYVKIISPQSINEPFLNMLVELSWASGRLLREYTVLLDPADAQIPEPVAPVVRAVQEDTGVTAGTDTVPAVQDQDTPQMTPVTSPPVAQQTMETRQSTAERTVQSPDTYGPILEGDTLSSIARQVKPEAVNINQMLVALYRANREAFIADNMNLLRTGVVLKIPDLQALTEIGEKEANAEVKVQVSDWHQYRQNLALTSQEPQDLEALKQTDSGQITTTVDSAAVTRAKTPEEVLRLSSGASASDSQDVHSDLSTQERVRMMEEDAIARNLALQEANERVAMLEKNIENLQKLLALQSSDLKQAQINAQAQAQQPQSEVESIEVIQSDAISPSEAELDIITEGDAATTEPDVMTEADSTTLPATEMAETRPVAPAVPVEPVSNPIQFSEPEEASVLDQVMDNLTYIGAITAILLLTLLAFVFRRRRKAAEAEAEAEESRYEELSSALRNKTAAAVAAAHVGENEKDQQDEFDQSDHFFPEEESQASDDGTKIDLTSDSDEPVKTLEQASFDSDQAIELDFSNENEQTENEAAHVLTESDSSTGMNEFDDNDSSGIGSLSDTPDETADTATAIDFDTDSDEKKPSMREQDSEHALDELTVLLGSDDQSEASVSAKDTEIDDEHSIDFPDNEVNLADHDTDNYELKIDFDETKESHEAHESNVDASNNETEPEPKSESQSDDNALDFSAGPSAIDLSDESNPDDENNRIKDSETNLLDIPESDSSSEAQNPDVNADTFAASEKETSEIDFSDISLDIENPAEISDHQGTAGESESSPASSESSAKSEQWHEIETKIDLAKAYLEMEDKEGAREMLEEVVQEGDDNQQKTATELLEKL